MDPEFPIAQRDRVQTFFDRSTSTLTEEDASFAPRVRSPLCPPARGPVMGGAQGSLAPSFDGLAHHLTLEALPQSLSDGHSIPTQNLDDRQEPIRARH